VSEVLGGLLFFRKSGKQRLDELLLWQALEHERPGVLLLCAFVSPAFVAGEVGIVLEYGLRQVVRLREGGVDPLGCGWVPEMAGVAV
jgi:hypothetical protein